eukprot:3685077-Rhodomonas_salina.3
MPRRAGGRFSLSGFGFRASGFGFRVSGFGFRASGFGLQFPNIASRFDSGLWTFSLQPSNILNPEPDNRAPGNPEVRACFARGHR